VAAHGAKAALAAGGWRKAAKGEGSYSCE